MEEFSFHHVGVAVRDLSKAIPIYKSLFEYELTSGPFDDPIQNVSVCFLSRGNGDIFSRKPGSNLNRILIKHVVENRYQPGIDLCFIH